MAKTLSIGYSPCPNDTFIFYGLIHGILKSDEFRFDQVFHDVETLNQMAMKGRLDITKVSFHALGHIWKDYCLLRSGGALGRGCGPLIVAREECSIDDLAGEKIAVPGRFTTAFLLLNLYNTRLGDNVMFMAFHEIMDAVKDGSVDAGLIIHESRFTYPLYGLTEIIDLGDWWERETGLPIPLGAIVAKRSLGDETIMQVDGLIRRSVEYARENSAEPMDYIKKHARELDDDVIKKHIDLYVNELSVDIGGEGEEAVRRLMGMAEDLGLFEKQRAPLFVT